MGWTHSTNSNKATSSYEQKKEEARLQRLKEESAAAVAALPQEESFDLQTEVERYASTLTVEEATETVEFLLSLAQKEGYLLQLAGWLKENNFTNVTDPQLMAAALEVGREQFTY